MTRAALVQRAGTGKTVCTGRLTVEYLAPSTLTGDAIGIYQLTLGPNAPGAGPHYHHLMSEAFHIQSGVLALLVDGEPVDAAPGDFVLVPPGVVHAFANRGDSPAVFTLTFAPGLSREGFFEGLAALASTGRLTDKDAMLALMGDYDQVPVDGIAGWT